MPRPEGTDPALTLDGEGEGVELVGEVIDGRYRLDAMLGRGGMGLVYRATHVGLRRQVAVKILHPSLAASSEVRNRFEREALAVGKVDHPNCVATYDVGRLADGSLYLAMELLEGKSLADVLEEEAQLAIGRALHILAHILRGLSGIHAAGLIHRDIKPENIFLVQQGDDMDFAKILDFGIAKPISGELSDDGVRLTQAGMAFGTPIYMAPEQALGNPMDGRADLYAAAVIGYEMLCGQPPFYSEDKLEVMSMHTAKPVPPMRSRLARGGKAVPSSIERLVIRGLTKKPGDRYANAEAFLAAVESAMATTDGGVTQVAFERPRLDTGAQPLVGLDGSIAMDGDDDPVEEEKENISGAIEEALQIAAPTARQHTPTRGEKASAPTLPAPPVVAAGEARGRMSGVGIGLPYTGPSGEPIFGLTPEQRLAQVPKTRKLWLYGAIGVAAIAIGVVIAIATKPSHRPKLDPATPAGRAADALESGNPARAIEILQHAPIDKDADAQLVLGHAYAARRASGDAIDAYQKAFALRPAAGADPKLLANLHTMAADRDPDVLAKALDLWIATSDPEAKKALLAATVSQTTERRHVAQIVVQRHKLDDQVDWVVSYGLDLDKELTCEKRRDAVAHLRALDNPKAVVPLELAIVKRNAKKNACLVDDAKAAIGYLKALKPK